MPWSVARVDSALHVEISTPMIDGWEPLMDEIQAQMDPKPSAIHLPSRLETASRADTDLLALLWVTLGSVGVPLLPL
jgi:hypothetical protein